MTRYLLDTNELIHYSRDQEPYATKIRAMMEARDEMGVSPVCVAEFFSNLAPGQRLRWQPFLEALDFWPATFEDGVRAGIYRCQAARAGRPLSTPDTLIAATARRVGAILITENLKDFPMDDVRVMSLAS